MSEGPSEAEIDAAVEAFFNWRSTMPFMARTHTADDVKMMSYGMAEALKAAALVAARTAEPDALEKENATLRMMLGLAPDEPLPLHSLCTRRNEPHDSHSLDGMFCPGRVGVPEATEET